LCGVVVLAVATNLGRALLSTERKVKYRDIIPLILQFGLYVSPVGFSRAVVPGLWRPIYSLNPVVGVIDGFRWCLLSGESHLYLPGFLLSIGVVLALLLTGIHYFRRTEQTFGDLF
jgi:lipopolysaccharide transport system permease protein